MDHKPALQVAVMLLFSDLRVFLPFPSIVSTLCGFVIAYSYICCVLDSDVMCKVVGSVGQRRELPDKQEEIFPVDVESLCVIYMFVGFYAHWPFCTLGGRYHYFRGTFCPSEG